MKYVTESSRTGTTATQPDEGLHRVVSMSVTDIRRAANPAAVLVEALERYASAAAYTAGPDAVTATVTIGGRTVEVVLPPEAVENLTLLAIDLADDLANELGGLEREYAAKPTVRTVPVVSRPRFSVLAGGVA